MHPITVRTMKFDVPRAADFHPLYIAGNAALSYSHTAIGLYSAQMEPFVVKSLRRVLDQIREDALREDADRFCRQEAQHYQRHIDFNKIVFATGYPGLEERVDALRREFDGYLANETDRFRVGFTEGFESFTSQFAMRILASGVYDDRRTARPFGELFKWHMLEEMEHRNVAFDVYEHLYPGYFYRARMCWMAQRHIFRFIADCIELMSTVDVPRYGEQCRVTAAQKRRITTSRLGMHLRSMMPGYTPHKYSISPDIAELSAYFTQIAESVR